MTGYGETVKKIAMRLVGEARIEEICRKFGLTMEDGELMDRLWSELKLDYSLDDVVALCEKYKDYANIGRVLQAWELMANEAARISTLRLRGKGDGTE